MDSHPLPIPSPIEGEGFSPSSARRDVKRQHLTSFSWLWERIKERGLDAVPLKLPRGGASSTDYDIAKLFVRRATSW
jgi:hypothetical protein